MACVIIHVYDDGDIELTRFESEPRNSFQSMKLSFSDFQIKRGALKKELLSYGAEEPEIDAAIAYVTKGKEGTNCIVGKV